MTTPVLIPVNFPEAMEVPNTDNPAEMKKFIVKFFEDYRRVRDTLKVNVDRLSFARRESNGKPVPPAFGSGPVGYGVGLNALTGEPYNLAVSSYKNGLVLANGTDRGKVNVSFNYLGVGSHITGSGASVTYTADFANTVGTPNALDTGTEAANTWYAVHVIVGETGTPVRDETANNLQPPLWRKAVKTATLLSTSGTAPVLPPGFNRFRRVGWVRNNGASDLYRFVRAADSPWITWNEDVSAGDFLVLTTAAAAVVFTDVSCAAVAPPTCRWIQCIARTTDGVATGAMFKNKDAGNIVWATPLQQVRMQTANVNAQSQFELGCDASQVVQYRGEANTNDVDLVVLGYRDEV